ncbi:hypothetical protein ACET3Z_027390 [Daucus carota]
MVYMGMLFSWFAWHVEDHDLHSINYMHTGDRKTWYIVPQDAAAAFEDVIRIHGYKGEINPILSYATLAKKTMVMSPEAILNAGIPCCRLVQNPREFVVTFPRAYHSGFSHGFNCSEASNIATSEWLREMAVEGLSGEDEGSELVLAIETEGGFDKGKNFGEGIGGENDQGGLGGFRDGYEFGSKLCEKENRVGDCDLKDFINDEVKFEERESEKLGGVEGDEGDYKEMKDGDKDKDGSKWSEIENEGGIRVLEGIENEAEIKERNPKNHSVVEGNEIGGNYGEIGNKGGDCDLKGIEDEMAIEERNPENRSILEENEGALKEIKEGIKWSEIGNEGGDRDLEGIKDETAIEERNPENLRVVEENEGAFKEIKEGDKNKAGSKWSEIGNEDDDLDLEGIKDETEIKERNTEKRSVVEENGSVVEENEGGSDIKNEGSDHDLKGITDEAKIGQRNPEKRSTVEENEGDFKEMKEGGSDKEGINWGEIEEAEEIYLREVKNRRADKGKEVIEDYEDGWGVNWDDIIEDSDDNWDYVIEDSEDGCGENWDDGAVRAKANQEQQYFDNYENERDINNKEPHWFGSNCKFNHPVERKNQYYLSPGGCKNRKACRYSHGKGKAAVIPNLELNFIGLPIRVGKKECSFCMKTGSCKFGENCKFHHPDATAVGGGDTTSPGRGRSSASDINETAPFRTVISPPENAEWIGYQAPAYGRSQGILPVPPALAMSIPATGSSFDAHPQGRSSFYANPASMPVPPALAMTIPATGSSFDALPQGRSSFYANPQGQVKVDKYPERPGQPECSFYMRTGVCRFKSSCRFHHPRNPEMAITLSDQGLPLRPGQRICSHFRRYGICKYGPLCTYDHSVGGTAASSDGSDQGRP